MQKILKSCQPPRSPLFFMSTLLINFIVLFCITARSSSAADDGAHRPTTYYSVSNEYNNPSSTSSSTRQLDDIPGPGGSCHLSVSTGAVQDAISGNGIVFAVKSDDLDDDGLMITSLGFHVNPDAAGVGYKVYALIDNGYFADPDRDPSTAAPDDQGFDYRGELAWWELIAAGTIDNLTLSTLTADSMEKDFFQVPFEVFNKTRVLPNGGVRSFYISTEKGIFIYQDPDPDNMVVVNAEMELIGNGGDTPSLGDYAPKVLVGEGVVSWEPLPFLFQPKLFVGKVYYENECSSMAPSTSASPTDPPSLPLSESPSVAPTITWAPSNAPTLVASEGPSSMPSLPPTIYSEKLPPGGLLLTLAMGCERDVPLPWDDIDAIVATVRETASRASEKEKIYNVNTAVFNIWCVLPFEERRLAGGNPVSRKDAAFINNHHRQLPTGSSALDFSMVITGEYRPARRPGEKPPPPKKFDLGKVTEDSINRDPQGFVKDLKERSSQSSSFAEVEADDLAVESFYIDPDIDLEDLERVTKTPTQRPTALLAATTLEENSDNSILVICIVITGGIIALLGAFLLFRHGERRAAKKRREKMARLEEQKERRRAERRKQAEWEEKNNYRHAGNAGMNDDHIKGAMVNNGPPPSQYGAPPMGYGHQPPPNYYAGGTPHPPQNYNYAGYGGPPPSPYGQNGGPPPPPYGQNYGGPSAQGYPYPPVPPPANYGQQPPRESSVRWKQ